MRHQISVHRIQVHVVQLFRQYSGDCRPYVWFMEVKLNPELQAKLASIAAENNSGAEEFVQHLVEHYMDRDAWFRQKVRTGLDHLAHGDFVTHEEIGARRALIRCSARKIGFAGQLAAFEIGLYCSYGGIRRGGCPSGCA